MFFRFFYLPAARVEETKTKSFKACYSRTYCIHLFLLGELCSKMAIRSHQWPPHSRYTQCEGQVLLSQRE